MSYIGNYDISAVIIPVQTLTGDVGGAITPTIGNINILGGNNVTVTGTLVTSTLSVAVTGTTDHAVQVGNATGSLTSLGIGLTAQVLKGNTAANPSWGAVDLTTDVTGLLPVGSGGTGVGSIAAHCLIVGNVTAATVALATGAANQVLQSGGVGADPAWSTATYPATTSQGDVLYSSADNTVAGLAKDATATRYLSNTGASNNPAWAQVNLANGVTGTLPVGNGGLGVADPTDHCVLVGSGNAAVTPITVGATGELLCGVTGADPDFASSSDGDFAFTSATATVQRTLTVSNTDNTAALSPANVQVTVGGATNTGDPFINFLVSGAGTYSVGIDNTVAGDPFKITSGASPSAGTDLITMTSAGVITLANDLDVSEGGTGVSTLTSHGILLGNGAGDIQALAEASHGQIPIGSTGANPVLATLTEGANITITNAAGSITIASTASGGLTWSAITADLNPMVVDNGYICNKAGLLTVTLPAACAVGKVFRATGINTDVGWRIAQNAGQQIHFGNLSTTAGAGGYLESTHKRDSVELVCVVVDAEFNVVSATGNITIA